MKQLDHGNILPFYGVSTAVADFCLVFPWYENGNIMEYLKRKSDANRFSLVITSGKVLHSRHLLPSTNSYLVRPADCASCMKPIQSTVSWDQYAKLRFY